MRKDRRSYARPPPWHESDAQITQQKRRPWKKEVGGGSNVGRELCAQREEEPRLQSKDSAIKTGESAEDDGYVTGRLEYTAADARK